VVRAEEYIKANRSRKLQQYGKTEVENWLILLGRKSSLQDWQLKQACHAIQILFQDLLEIDWVTTFDWEHSNPARYWVRTILTCPKSTIYSAKHALAMAIYCRSE
jgi:hypothetical protein